MMVKQETTAPSATANEAKAFEKPLPPVLPFSAQVPHRVENCSTSLTLWYSLESDIL